MVEDIFLILHGSQIRQLLAQLAVSYPCDRTGTVSILLCDGIDILIVLNEEGITTPKGGLAVGCERHDFVE